MTDALAHSAAEDAARTSYGRLLAYLAARTRDVAAAEDALSEAFVGALRTWPVAGVPHNPEAWLLTAARNRLVDSARHDAVRSAAAETLRRAAETAERTMQEASPFPDERLELLFLCAHPALDRALHTPLMLQSVLGLDAATIASAFLVAPAAMSQRLVRAKAKIRDARMRFELPEAEELPARLTAVLEAVYAAYGTGWEGVHGADPRYQGLAAEAISLGRAIAELMPSSPEVHGLLALMLHCEARRAARRDASGGYVPLSEQDPQRWSRPLMIEAEEHLHMASQYRTLGRFQLEAAIQSAHARRAFAGNTDWAAIAHLYEGLIRIAPTVGGSIGHAAAIAEAYGPAAGLATLERLPKELVTRYQPYWALAGHLHAKLGQASQARAAYEHAIGLAEDPAVQEFLTEKLLSCR